MCYIRDPPYGGLTWMQMAKIGAAPVSLFGGVEDEINRVLGVGDYRRGPDARTLQARPPSRASGAELVTRAFAVVRKNFPRILANPDRRFSSQNWRMHSPKVHSDPKNTSPETLLERGLVAACVAVGRRDWWNQVPVASGLVSSTAGRRRAIDLVRERNPGAFDFVELKVESDSPIYAAVEIMLYGFVWLLSRKAKATLGYPRGTLLDGRDVALSVLAPAKFYGSADYGKFQDGVRAALTDVGKSEGATMSFRFEQFPLSPDARGAHDSPTLDGRIPR